MNNVRAILIARKLKKGRKKQMKNQKGITLIALIITIIVMLILVGVSVTVALDGGLFSTAKTSKDQTQYELDKEKLLSIVIGALDNKGRVDFGNLKTAIEATDGEFIAIDAENGIYESEAGNKFKVLSNGSIIDYAGDTPVTPPAATTGSWQVNGTTNKLEYVAPDGTVTATELTIGSPVAYDEGTSGFYVTDASKGIGTSREVTFDDNGEVYFNLEGGTFTAKGGNGTVAAGDLNWKVFNINSDGQIELISTTPTTEKLYFRKSEQVTTIDENTALNDFCYGIYGQGDYAQEARSLSLTDINNLTGVNHPNNNDSVSYIALNEVSKEYFLNQYGENAVVGYDTSGLIDYSAFWVSTDKINSFRYYSSYNIGLSSCLTSGNNNDTGSVENDAGCLPVYPIVILEPDVNFTYNETDAIFEFAE